MATQLQEYRMKTLYPWKSPFQAQGTGCRDLSGAYFANSLAAEDGEQDDGCHMPGSLAAHQADPARDISPYLMNKGATEDTGTQDLPVSRSPDG